MGSNNVDRFRIDGPLFMICFGVRGSDFCQEVSIYNFRLLITCSNRARQRSFDTEVLLKFSGKTRCTPPQSHIAFHTCVQRDVLLLLKCVPFSFKRLTP